MCLWISQSRYYNPISFYCFVSLPLDFQHYLQDLPGFHIFFILIFDFLEIAFPFMHSIFEIFFHFPFLKFMHSVVEEYVFCFVISFVSYAYLCTKVCLCIVLTESFIFCLHAFFLMILLIILYYVPFLGIVCGLFFISAKRSSIFLF